ncbi:MULTISPECIES: DUF4179 domain-containing protein [unclassified Clostridium]|uniref:DUF4179 domain-containing protein n=1 Tax=unclassified Clostridium TaxID=2614128 RepID=UPI001C8BC3AD|nr:MULTISPECIES: DUF4179 domain-containing protein [unclassified Clostridium]MBX9136793.1 DUF4179 domain-containing protein [Clostridium sp. K12(2020)]MBX9143603.1 DUF4179 domain-containing protein [Clostridium sp. K13]MDU2289638.1 DUF4179 domain-containing protein [Clostridium celatum]MDU4325920.1 DUF4179 domain-containing protein [Clostridium celatum]
MNFDDKLNKVVNDEINIPESILKKKDIAFEEIRKSKKKKRRFNNGFIAAAVLLILVTGIFSIKGENVLATIKEFIFKYNQGVEKAVENGYYKQLQDYTVSSDGVEIKIDKVILNSKTLFASFVINFEDSNLIDELESIFVDMDIDYEDKKNQQPMFMSKSEVDIENKEVHCYFTYPLDKQINGNYLKININEITLMTNSESKLSWDPSVSELDKESYTARGIKIFKKFKSLWSFDLDVNSIIQEDINYSYSSLESTGEMELVSAELSPTAMKIIIKDCSELNFYELSLIITDMKLTNDNGETFGILETIISEEEDNVKYIKVIFEATVFDENENLYLEIIKDDGTIVKFKLKKN